MPPKRKQQATEQEEKAPDAGLQQMDAINHLLISFKTARKIGVSPRDLVMKAAKLAMIERTADNVFKANPENLLEVRWNSNKEEEDEEEEGEDEEEGEEENDGSGDPWTNFCTASVMTEIHMRLGQPPWRRSFDLVLYRKNPVSKSLDCHGEVHVDFNETDMLEFLRFASDEMTEHTEDVTDLIEVCQSL